MNELKDVTLHFLGRNNKEGIRDHAMYFLCHFGMMRGHEDGFSWAADPKAADANRKFYSRRNTIIKRLEALAEEHAQPQERVAEAMEEWRKLNNKSLATLEKACKANEVSLVF